jgi:hypothetical protein
MGFENMTLCSHESNMLSHYLNCILFMYYTSALPEYDGSYVGLEVYVIIVL